ncbi:MAG: TonB-dependent receptor [Bacteroidia bacterium]
MLPAFLGEVDVLRSIQLLPGVSTVGEGSAGFNVRGGQTDQNLTLYDGMQLFNPTHALGFFSAFHPAASEKFDLYKGHVPAEYGGRAPAVLTVETKKPNLEKRKTELAISPFMGNAMVEGPIFKDRTSFLLAGRVSWANWMLKSIHRLEDVRNSRASFHDLTGKLHHAFSSNSQLSLSLYDSGDELQFADQYGYAWGTRLASMSWQRIAGTDWLFKSMLGTGRYRAELYEPTGLEAFRISNGLVYHQAQQTVRYAGLANHKLQAGMEWIQYQGQDEELKPFEEGGLVVPLVYPKTKAMSLRSMCRMTGQ